MSEKLPSANLNSYSSKLRDGQITTDTLLKEREMLLDLYKHHLKVLLEANVFIYAVTGAIASFVIAHTSIPGIRWVILLPIVVCALFAVLFFLVSFDFNHTQEELDQIAGGLNTNTFSIIAALPLSLRFSATWLIVIVGLLVTGLVRFPSLRPSSFEDAMKEQRFSPGSDSSIALDRETGQLCNTVP